MRPLAHEREFDNGWGHAPRQCTRGRQLVVERKMRVSVAIDAARTLGEDLGDDLACRTPTLTHGFMVSQSGLPATGFGSRRPEMK